MKSAVSNKPFGQLEAATTLNVGELDYRLPMVIDNPRIPLRIAILLLFSVRIRRKNFFVLVFTGSGSEKVEAFEDVNSIGGDTNTFGECS